MIFSNFTKMFIVDMLHINSQRFMKYPSCCEHEIKKHSESPVVLVQGAVLYRRKSNKRNHTLTCFKTKIVNYMYCTELNFGQEY